LPENLMSRAHALLSASLEAQPDHISGIKNLIN